MKIYSPFDLFSLFITPHLLNTMAEHINKKAKRNYEKNNS